VNNTRLAKMQLKQFAQINLEDHLDQFDAYADRFQRLPLYYLTFHGSNQVRFYQRPVFDSAALGLYSYPTKNKLFV
jgi:hypothetical protein